MWKDKKAKSNINIVNFSSAKNVGSVILRGSKIILEYLEVLFWLIGRVVWLFFLLLFRIFFYIVSLFSKSSSRKNVFRFVSLVVALFIISLSVLFAAVAKGLPSVEQIRNHSASESTKIFDNTGAVLLYEIGPEGKRTFVPLSSIPASLKNATIASEDENFYNGFGFIDVRGVIRAFLVNIKRGGVVQGGSTITQQLAKNAFLTPERTYIRKAKELLLSIQLTRYHSKDEVLELYLNEVPYGPTFYGVESASLAYFGKSAPELTIKESALLAALPKAPSYYSPWGNNVSELLLRTERILEKMKDLGYLSQQEYEIAIAEKIEFQPRDPFGIKAPHFVIMVQEYLVEKYGEDLVQRGGLKVKTTIDWKLQESAEKIALEGAERNEELYGGTNSSMVVVDSSTGQILAMVGSRNYFDENIDGNFNVATQGLRQPGSALKPFVYLAALERGYSPDTVIFDVPTEFSTNPSCPESPIFTSVSNKVCFHPQNFDLKFRGPVSLKRALSQSINVPAVKTLYLVGLENAIKTMNSLGIKTLNDPSRYGLSLVLGGGEVRLIDLISAYGVLSQEGRVFDTKFVSEVQNPKGKKLEKTDESDGIISVVSEDNARAINQILSDIDLRSGLFQSSLPMTIFQGHEVALKTGTTNDYRDAWAIGYTPSVVVGVWAGNNDNSPMHAQGSSILAAVPMWSKLMSETLKTRPFEPFQRPSSAYVLEKPMLRGEFVTDQGIHSILYYVEKENPNGQQPTNPFNDPQFKNWEFGVGGWVSQNYIPSGSAGINMFPIETSAPFIEILSPINGDSVEGEFLVNVEVSSRAMIEKVVVSFNNKEIKIIEGLSGPSARIQFSINEEILQQNSLTVKVIDSNNMTGLSSLVIYKKQ